MRSFRIDGIYPLDIKYLEYTGTIKIEHNTESITISDRMIEELEQILHEIKEIRNYKKEEIKK